MNMCPGCHNPQSWDIESGRLTEIDDIMAKIVDEDFCNVTFSGGDPMMQAEGFAELADRIHAETKKDIWCYTGYRYEEIIADERKMRLMRAVDVIVDGRFVRSLRDESLLFRGSSNQRIIDVQRTLREGRVVEFPVERGVEVAI